MRPYYWPQRIAIALACAGAVLVLSLGGCERRTCVRWHEEWRLYQYTDFGCAVGDPYPKRFYVCDQWADGGGR